MSIWEALVLGIVQGATEFLPVSSSGHLVLLQKIFGITEPALVFDTAVHVGTLVAVFIVLWQDIWNILRRIIQPLTLFLIIATIPAVIAALLFMKPIEAAFASGSLLGFSFLLTALLLFGSELLYRRSEKPGGLPAKLEGSALPRDKDEMNWVDALVIGIFQAVAIIPGLSRSGATISAAIGRKINRDFAARFSFLLSIPAILGAVILQLKDFVKAGSAGLAQTGSAVSGGGAGTIGILPIMIGAISAFIVALFSIRLALKIVRQHSLNGFAIYTGILGILVLVDIFGTHFFF
ncbi:MAG: undecaprenyl-diphosphate phosphatase [Treponema sp.]|nr:undecaprenyl-diphosphate phosphatase [Treponema sp.]